MELPTKPLKISNVELQYNKKSGFFAIATYNDGARVCTFPPRRLKRDRQPIAESWLEKVVVPRSKAFNEQARARADA